MKSTDFVSVISIGGLEKEEKNSLDVVLIGASEVYTSYSPTMAWEEYGYTSYDLASPGIPGNLYLPLLREVLRRQNPKVVVFEVNGFMYEDFYYEREGEFRNVIDNLPWSENKVETIKTLVSPDDRMSYYLPLITYHSNWSSPGSFAGKFLYKMVTLFKGAINLKGYSTYTFTYEEDQKVKGNTNGQLTEKSKKYLDELLAYCKDQGIENVLFLRAPHQIITQANKDVLQGIENEINAYGYEMLDCGEIQSEIGLDMSTDYYNKDHVNIRGTEKFTSWLGNYLTTTYDLEPSSSEETTEKWNKAAEKADQLFAECRQDLEDGVVRHYIETSFYVKFPPLEDPYKELSISK